jgi:hypothetical protein
MRNMHGARRTELKWTASPGASSGRTTKTLNFLGGSGKKQMNFIVHLHDLPLAPLPAALPLESRRQRRQMISMLTWGPPKRRGCVNE